MVTRTRQGLIQTTLFKMAAYRSLRDLRDTDCTFWVLTAALWVKSMLQLAWHCCTVTANACAVTSVKLGECILKGPWP